MMILNIIKDAIENGVVCVIGDIEMNMQEIIDTEQNKVIEKAYSMTHKELITFLLIHKRLFIQDFPFKYTRKELIDMYCEVVFEMQGL